MHTDNSAFRLVVADPGYIRNFDPTMLDHAGITKIESLPHREIIKHVQESF